MGFNIQNINATMRKYGGLARPSRFEVHIIPPISITGFDNHDLMFMAEKARLPGISQQTHEIRHSGYGVIEKMPYQTSFLDLDVTFLVDEQGMVLSLFHEWMRLISRFARTGGSVTATNEDLYNYPETYQTTMEILQYDVTGSQVQYAKSQGVESGHSLKYIIDRAYPVTINPIELGWEMQNQVEALQVTFAYSFWRTGRMKDTETEVRPTPPRPYDPSINATTVDGRPSGLTI